MHCVTLRSVLSLCRALVCRGGYLPLCSDSPRPASPVRARGPTVCVRARSGVARARCALRVLGDLAPRLTHRSSPDSPHTRAGIAAVGTPARDVSAASGSANSRQTRTRGSTGAYSASTPLKQLRRQGVDALVELINETFKRTLVVCAIWHAQVKPRVGWWKQLSPRVGRVAERNKLAGQRGGAAAHGRVKETHLRDGGDGGQGTERVRRSANNAGGSCTRDQTRRAYASGGNGQCLRGAAGARTDASHRSTIPT